MVCTYDDLGTDDDIGDEPSDYRVPLIDEYDDRNSTAFTTPCALNDLEIYDVTSRPQK